MIDYKAIADELINDRLELFGFENTILRLLDMGLSKRELMELQFEEDVIDHVILKVERGDYD